MVAIKETDDSLKLKASNCDNFDVTIIVAEKDFLRELFLQALPHQALADFIKAQRGLVVTCNRQTKKIDYRVRFGFHPSEVKPSKSSKVHFHLTFEPTDVIAPKEEPPPFAHEIFQWLSRFISSDAKIELSEEAIFKFPVSSYRSVFSLPLLLSGTVNTTGHELFEGSQMTGVRIAPRGNNVGISRVTHQVSKKSIDVQLYRNVESSSQKLKTIEEDIPVLGEIAQATVRQRREK